jgi:hypothetical protein
MIVTVHADDFPSVRVFAAGSLRAAINETTNAFQTKTGIRVESSFGPSGTLRDRIAKGEHADLFASADIGNPAALSRAEGLARLFYSLAGRRRRQSEMARSSVADIIRCPRVDCRSSVLLMPRYEQIMSVVHTWVRRRSRRGPRLPSQRDVLPDGS